RGVYINENLLNINGKNPGDYGRRLLRVLYTQDQIKTCMLPSTVVSDMTSNTKTATPSVASEDVYGEKWDRCVTDTLVKAGRPWPVLLGTGIGIGMGYSNCQNDFRSPYLYGRTLNEKQTVKLPTKSST
ncbi:unnamed protein product, partial [Didymodactylos carnosus]